MIQKEKKYFVFTEHTHKHKWKMCTKKKMWPSDQKSIDQTQSNCSITKTNESVVWLVLISISSAFCETIQCFGIPRCIIDLSPIYGLGQNGLSAKWHSINNMDGIGYANNIHIYIVSFQATSLFIHLFGHNFSKPKRIKTGNRCQRAMNTIIEKDRFGVNASLSKSAQIILNYVETFPKLICCFCCCCCCGYGECEYLCCTLAWLDCRPGDTNRRFLHAFSFI